MLRGGRVVDGTGGPWYRADVAVREDTIVAVGVALPGEGRRTIDLTGWVIAPGFIDVHTHARRGILGVPTADNYVLQGVTTLFDGQDGSSPLPLGEFLARVAALPPAVNFGSFVGHGSVREAVMGGADRAPSPAELQEMIAIVAESMREGAFGLSTGLFYVPGAFADTDEVVALARAAGERGGLHVSHMRDEAAGVLDSVRETVAIGEGGGLPTQVTHHKIIGRAGWGRSVETLGLVAEARRRGVDVTIDQYPYTASSTSFAAALFPAWALEGDDEARAGRLADPVERGRIRAAVIEKVLNERGGGDASRLQVAAFPHDPGLDGKTLAEVLRERGREASVEAAADLVLEIVDGGGATGIFHAMSEEDVERILASPFTMVASDGEIPVFGQGRPHPRSYGTFARVLGVYVREKGVLSLEEAVRKMTSLPAARVGLADRGLVRPGMKADLVAFDPATIRDRATFEEPHAVRRGGVGRRGQRPRRRRRRDGSPVCARAASSSDPGRGKRGAMSVKRVEVETDGGVARVWLNRPEVRNAFDGEMVTELRGVLDDLAADETVRVVVLGGRGPVFSAGADLGWMKTVAGFGPEDNLREADALASLFHAIHTSPKPFVARVHGAALGGGSGLVAACDIAVAAEGTRFGFTEVRLGLIPAVISPYVVGRIGESAARELFLTGERFEAARALAIGLVRAVVPEADLDAAVDGRVGELLRAGPTAIGEAKALLDAVCGRPIEEVRRDTVERIARVRASPEGREGLRAFLEKRPPGWVD